MRRISMSSAARSLRGELRPHHYGRSTRLRPTDLRWNQRWRSGGESPRPGRPVDPVHGPRTRPNRVWWSACWEELAQPALALVPGSGPPVERLRYSSAACSATSLGRYRGTPEPVRASVSRRNGGTTEEASAEFKHRGWTRAIWAADRHCCRACTRFWQRADESMSGPPHEVENRDWMDLVRQR